MQNQYSGIFITCFKQVLVITKKRKKKKIL